VKIDLTELMQKVGSEADVEQTEKVSFPEDALNLTKPVKIKIHLINSGSSVLMNGVAEAEAELECSRCLKTFKFPLSVKIEEEFTKEPFVAKGGKEIELREEDFTCPIEKDNTIDLTELIRQELLLAMPISTICNADCKGVQKEEEK
jgi:uncharacterized protein